MAWSKTDQVTRKRVLYREIKLTGLTGKIERSAEALLGVNYSSLPFPIHLDRINF
jgi:hypothetical protein